MTESTGQNQTETLLGRRHFEARLWLADVDKGEAAEASKPVGTVAPANNTGAI